MTMLDTIPVGAPLRHAVTPTHTDPRAVKDRVGDGVNVAAHEAVATAAGGVEEVGELEFGIVTEGLEALDDLPRRGRASGRVEDEEGGVVVADLAGLEVGGLVVAEGSDVDHESYLNTTAWKFALSRRF